MNINDVIPLTKQLYESDGGCVGCCLHIVLDDGNLETSNIQYCLDYARQRNHLLCIEIAEKMLQLTKTQRKQIYINKNGKTNT